jgi:hypothetical protein
MAPWYPVRRACWELSLSRAVHGGGDARDGAQASPMVVAAKTGENTSASNAGASNAGANDDGDATRPVRDCPQ